MPFVSYAQNFEDVILWRALQRVEKGFFIDIGANHPTVDSVTYAFYERGWSGLNLEPEATSFALLQEKRPRDTNLAVAAGDRITTLPLYDFGVRGLTTVSKSVADRHVRAGLKLMPSTEVPVVPLADVCAQYVKGEVHFLKVDVEGSEAAVIRGMDFKKWRPWILVVEATIPNSQEPSHEEWEPMVTAAAYRPAYFDGLSKYYVSEEHYDELAPSMVCQPNVFDDFMPAPLVETRRELAAARREIAELQMMNEPEFLKNRITQLERQLESAQTALASTREVFSQSELRERETRHKLQTLAARLQSYESNPYFKTLSSLRTFAAKTRRRATRQP